MIKKLLALLLTCAGIGWAQQGCTVLSNGWLGCTQLPSSCISGSSPDVYYYTTQKLYLCLNGVYTLSSGGATIAATTNTIRGDGAGNGVAVTGTATNCVLVNGTSAACGSGTANAAQQHSVTFSATPTFTCTSATNDTVDSFALSTALSANITSSTLATCTPGQTLNFVFTQATSPSGPFTVTMPTGFSQACQVSPISASNTKMSFWWNGTTAELVNCSADIGPGVVPTQAAPAIAPASGTVFTWADSSSNTLEAESSAGVIFTLTGTIGTGTATMGTAAIASGTCATVVTVASSQITTGSKIVYTPSTDPTAVTGYGPSASGSLYIWAYPTAGNANFKVCNNTSGSITPSALTLNWSAGQ